ncbi:ribonuclease III [Natroniella sulfidigena]|uniref:Mini-ribonuclease 3 n=1 Tax=Natroniella sulfidigena TaxID=723921 RepID=UPI00200AEC8A|nr:ribonuclease III domain-containing protein [Natroniella sulfidigena]MCK8816228.1 ribonuclease III [Natroniella sulfidigena]
MLKEMIDFPARPNLLPPATMAYIGDSLFELFIRNLLLERNAAKPKKLHRQAIEYVNATAQAELLEQLREYLTEEELVIVRRGRNAKTNVPSSADPADYQYSTAFEALLGYLYLKGEEDRLLELFKLIKEIL